MTRLAFNGAFHDPPGELQDGYGRRTTHADIEQRRRELARELRIEEMRRCIHNCDEGEPS